MVMDKDAWEALLCFIPILMIVGGFSTALSKKTAIPCAVAFAVVIIGLLVIVLTAQSPN